MWLITILALTFPPHIIDVKTLDGAVFDSGRLKKLHQFLGASHGQGLQFEDWVSKKIADFLTIVKVFCVKNAGEVPKSKRHVVNTEVTNATPQHRP